MKILSVSHPRFFGVFLLGLFVAWGTAMPKLTRGYQVGGWLCSSAPDKKCKALEGEVCNSTCTRCNSSGDDNCIRKATHCTCADPYDGCVNVLWNQWCS